MGAKDPTLGSCILLGLESQCVLTRNVLNVMANLNPGEYMRMTFF